MKEKTVLVLDEEVDNHDFMQRDLQTAYGEEVTVLLETPLRTKEQMVERIQVLSDRLVALIFDERLYETGDCDYNGSELAAVYRAYDAKIPIYILTSYTTDVDESGDVEYVIDKGDLNEDKALELLSQKLRRHINIFGDIVDERHRALDALLIKHCAGGLNEDELKQLQQLQFWKSKGIELEESLLSESIKQNLDQKEQLLQELEAQLNKD